MGTPVRKPFLNRLDTVLRYRIRPVPVTFLRFAFSDQLSASQSRQWLRPRLSDMASVCWKRTLAGLSSRVAARSANLLLVVERPAAGGERNRLVNLRCPRPLRPRESQSRRSSASKQSVGVDLPAASAETVGLVVAGNSSQRSCSTQSVWKACRTYRLPKLEVPFAVVVCQRAVSPTQDVRVFVKCVSKQATKS